MSQQITEPVMPDDELFDYLVTQAIADYLAGLKEPALDGIIYPSVQDGGEKSNVVLFHKAARVEKLDIPPKTEICASLFGQDEDDAWPEYTVYENVPPAMGGAKGKSKTPEFDDDFLSVVTNHPSMSREDDARQATLKIDVNTVEVHHIEKVNYGKSKFGVARHRSEKRDPKF